VLVAALKDRDERVCEDAAQALGEMGAEAKEAAPALARLLDNSRPTVRVAGAHHLWRVTGDEKTALPILLKALKDKEHHTAYLALDALRSMGPAAKAAVPAIRECLRDPRFDHWAEEALKAIAPEEAAKLGVRGLR